MNLKPLYHLKERLEQAAIAGTGLLGEDVRLRRAVGELAPLVSASPVFARLEGAVQTLLTAPAEERPIQLLEALSLIHAVVYTQGTAGVSGTLTPMESAPGRYVEASYQQLQPLLTALTSTGSGRMAVVEQTCQEHPEYFADFRVLPLVVRALGDGYSELVQLAITILSRMGKTVLPALEQGFDPAGNREMTHRVTVMEHVAGGEANDFYLSRLEEAKKEVRAALIYALRHREDNAERLIELCETERGKSREMAHWALASLDSPAAWEYWDRLAAKQPRQAVQYMTLSTTSKASSLVAHVLDQWLAPYEADPDAPIDQDGARKLQALMEALPGKCGPDICQLYRRMAALCPVMDKKSWKNAQNQSMALRFYLPDRSKSLPNSLSFSQALAKALRLSLLLHPSEELAALAGELAQTDPIFVYVAIIGALLTKPTSEAFTLSEQCLHRWNVLKKQRNGRVSGPVDPVHILYHAMEGLHWNRQKQRQEYQISLQDPKTGFQTSDVLIHPIAAPLDRRWYPLLMNNKWADYQTDRLLFSLVDPEDQELCTQVGEYLYKRALTLSEHVSIHDYLRWLKELGWKCCKGLLVSWCRKQSRFHSGYVEYLIQELPGSDLDIADEVEHLLELAKKQSLKVGHLWDPAPLEEWVATVRQNAAQNKN